MGDETYTPVTIWNFDENQMKVLYELKIMAIEQFETRDVEGLYWTIRGMWREIDAKLNDTKTTKNKKSEQDKLKDDVDDLEEKRLTYLQLENKEDDNGEFYVAEETLYINICRLMKSHGLYYRVGDDPSSAAFRK